METLFAFGYSCTLRIGNEQLATSNDTNLIKNCVIYKEIN